MAQSGGGVDLVVVAGGVRFDGKRVFEARVDRLHPDDAPVAVVSQLDRSGPPEHLVSRLIYIKDVPLPKRYPQLVLPSPPVRSSFECGPMSVLHIFVE